MSLDQEYREKKIHLASSEHRVELHLQLRELILAVLIPLHEVAHALNLRPGRARRNAKAFCTFSVCGKITRPEETAAAMNT